MCRWLLFWRLSFADDLYVFTTSFSFGNPHDPAIALASALDFFVFLHYLRDEVELSIVNVKMWKCELLTKSGLTSSSCVVISENILAFYLRGSFFSGTLWSEKLSCCFLRLMWSCLLFSPCRLIFVFFCFRYVSCWICWFVESSSELSRGQWPPINSIVS